MKNVIVANFQPKNKLYAFTRLKTFIKAQIENSVELGWTTEDIILLTNFDYEFMGVKAKAVSLNHSCLTGSKMFAVYALFKDGSLKDEIWVHDLDAWQNVWFDCPEFKDVGICEYSRPTFNGGSVFYKPSARDITEAIVSVLRANREAREEPTIDKVLRACTYKHRVTVLNPTYNVGCSGFVERYLKSHKPIHVCHFHPHNRIAVETHLLDRNGLNVKSVGRRLERLIRKYFAMALDLSDEGKIARERKIKLRQCKLAARRPRKQGR
jgi:hypothetical protein